MKQVLLLLLLMSVSVISHSQEDAPPPPPRDLQAIPDSFPAVLPNIKTDRHSEITGTKIFLVIPKDFNRSTNFGSIVKGDSALIQVMELGSGFYTAIESFSREKFEEKGMKILLQQDFMTGIYPSKLVLAETKEVLTQTVVFGDSAFSYLVFGVSKLGDQKNANHLHAALKSIHYDKTFKPDPFELVGFRIDDTQSSFKFSTYASTIFIYTPGGIAYPSDKNMSMIMVNHLPVMTGSIKDAADALFPIYKPDGFADAIVRTESNIITNGYSGFLRVVYGKLKNKPVMLFQHTINLESQVVNVMGIAYTDHEKNLEEFKKLSATIRKK